MRMAARIEKINRTGGSGSNYVNHYDGTTRPSKAGPVWTGKVARARDKLFLKPLRTRKPTTWFVNSMGDLFHESIPDEWIDRAFAVMALCPQHTFQVLTKRAERMRAYLGGTHRWRDIAVACLPLVTMSTGYAPDHFVEDMSLGRFLPNVWLGVSAERQQEADERIPYLLETPAGVRFVSAEPLLGPIDLNSLCGGTLDALLGHDFEAIGDIRDGGILSKTSHPPGLDWVIVGGESGPNARPMHVGWALDLRDQCNAAGVPFFFKQHGEWHPRRNRPGIAEHCIAINGAISRGDELKGGPEKRPRWIAIERVGKKAAGRLLDGREHDDMPRTASVTA
jgi:protein gp37